MNKTRPLFKTLSVFKIPVYPPLYHVCKTVDKVRSYLRGFTVKKSVCSSLAPDALVSGLANFGRHAASVARLNNSPT